MAKKKHIWHCGHCHGDCVVMKRQKGTKYIFCPICDRQVAYYNPLPLLAAAIPLVAKGAMAAASVLPFLKKKKAAEAPQGQASPSQALQPREPVDRYTTEEKVKDALR